MSTNTSATGGPLLPENGTPTLAPDDPFDDLIQTIVVGVTGMPGNLVRPRWQSIPLAEPEAGTDWCAIGVIDETPDAGRPYVTHIGTEDAGLGADFVQVNDTASILASFYGPSARGNAMALRMGLMVPQNREVLQRAHMGLVGMPSPTRFVPSIVSMQTQRRADISFEVRRPNTIEVAVRTLLSAKLMLYPDAGKIQTATQGSTPPPD
jgi:hypothetical protein